MIPLKPFSAHVWPTGFGGLPGSWARIELAKIFYLWGAKDY